MSEANHQAIENAAAVIERFGGIRPMSTKTGVPVTTIQGWKKRDVIPANRVDDILLAAAAHNVNLVDLLQKAANDTATVESPAEAITAQDATEKYHSNTQTIPEMPVSTAREDAPHNAVKSTAEDNPSAKESAEEKPRRVENDISPRSRRIESHDFTQIAIETERKAVTKSAVITLFVVICVLGSLVMMLIPKIEQVDEHGQRLSSLEGQVSDVEQQQSMFKGLVSENWSQQLDDLKKQVVETRDSVEPALERMKEVSNDFLASGTDVAARVEKLENYVEEITSSTSLSSMYAKLSQMQSSLAGQQNLDAAMKKLLEIYNTLGTEGEDSEKVGEAIDDARGQDATLAQTFENVPAKDLQAGAMLLAMSQLRSSLNRENEPFNEDLALLMKMVGKDNLELRESLVRLAPYAEEGILTPSGLSNEFRTIAGDVVVSSLKGEDVSIMEKATAHMNDLVQVEKNGEMITGTKTQATVVKAQHELDNGNIAGAIDLLKSNLDSKELAPLKPWLNKAEAVLSAARVEEMIGNSIDLSIGTGYLGGAQLLQKQ